ncbi:MAG: phosphotransferase [Actinomycetota bacterium]|nr:phosphotransferase [Actinomycetota bacterium]
MSSPLPHREINAITFHVADLARSIAFYELLGGVVVFGGPDTSFCTLQLAPGADNFVNLQRLDGFVQASGAWGRVIFHVDSPDELYAKALAAGLTPEMAPSDASWGERYFHLRDPDGHEISLARRLAPVAAPVDPFVDVPPAETAEVRPGEQLDWAAIEAHLRTNLPADVDTSGAFAVEQFPNGAANLTYLVAFGDQTELVLRRPPFGTIAPGAHDMKREYKVLSKLWPFFDKAPRALLFCDNRTVAGSDFFVMERRRGEVIRGVVPADMRNAPSIGKRLGFALADTVAEFHLLDPEACGLADLGRPDGFVERQVSGWRKRWDLVADPRHDATMTGLHRRLASSVPPTQRVSFVHNDLKLDNCMFAAGDPDTVVAFFDWDMTTIGDPLIDFGTLMNYWPDPADSTDVKRASHDGMTLMGLPSRSEMATRYGERTGFDLAHLAWYEAFAQWKTAVVVQQLHHRWKVGDSTDERMATIADTLPLLEATADGLLSDIGV